MPETPGYNPELTADDKKAIGTAEAILAEGAKELEGATKIESNEDLGIAKDDLDEFEAGMDNLFAEDDNK